LLESGAIDQNVITNMKSTITNILEDAYSKSKNTVYKNEDWVTKDWLDIEVRDNTSAKGSGVPVARLKEIGSKIGTLPKDEKIHRLIKKIFEQRHDSIQKGVGIDWGTAEALAFGSLLQDGYHVRISGQDVERGTFSHRHSHVFYQDKMGYFNPINQVLPDDAGRSFIASNSHLSEFAVMGFELGYA